MKSYNKCISHQIAQIGKFSDTVSLNKYISNFPHVKQEQNQISVF